MDGRTQDSALDLMLGTALTRAPVDNARAVLAIRGYGPDAVPVILAKRRAWVDYLATTQRRWQRETRNPNKARHLDSIAIREQYVRCR